MPYKWNPFASSDTVTTLDIELLKKEVGQRFPFYDLRFNLETAAFYCRIDENTLEEKFEDLRRSLSEKGYIPMLRYEKGEHVIYVIRKTERKEKPVWVNIVLLIATIITTVLTGSLLYAGYLDLWSLPNPFDVLLPVNLFYGTILFALPLQLLYHIFYLFLRFFLVLILVLSVH